MPFSWQGLAELLLALTGLILLGLGLGWAFHPGIGVACAGGLLFVVTIGSKLVASIPRRPAE